MYKPFVRSVLTAVCVSLVLIPETSFACCFCDWFKHKEPVAVCPPPACAVAPQQVSYVPQTCYRTEYTCVPCTSYRPVSTCDPCGGGQTVMQPVTTYVQRAVQVPYTSYRPVATTLNYPAAAPCSTCGGAAPYYSSSYAAPAAVMPTAGCSTCGGAATASYAPPAAMYSAPPASYSAPANYGAPAATYGAPTYMPGPQTGSPSMGAPSMGTPTLAPPSGASTPSTFQPNSSNMPQDNSTLRPIQPMTPSDMPSTDSKTNSSSAPLLQDPQNRTTSAPLMGPAFLTTAIFRTADRANVFKPAVTETENWSATPGNEGWKQSDK